MGVTAMALPSPNSSPKRDPAVLCLLMALGLCAYLPGIGWGVPSRTTDAFLFGFNQNTWSAQQIQAAGGSWTPDSAKAADADANPLLHRDQVIVLNDTPQKQAEIIRRYRLYSNHPDEMLTFMALARMPAARFDPGMYQYGGLWFYPIGGLLRVAGALKLVTVKSDLSYYLDHPEDFGRFYVVARLYSGAWGLVGIWAVYRLGRRLFGGWILPAAVGASFALMPVVVNGAHEVKPHLAGGVLVLLAVLAALKYVQTGLTRWWVLTAVVCGLAFGMVLTAVVAFAVIPTMTLLRRQPWRQRLTLTLAAGGIGLAVYALTNPYVIIGLLRPDSPLRTNLANLRQAGALFGKANDRGALANSALLLVEGTSLPIAVFGIVGVAMIALTQIRRPTPPPGETEPPTPTSRTSAAILLAAPTLLALIQFVATAAGKPGEFGRFALLPDTALLLAAFALAHLGTKTRPRSQPLAAGILVILTAIFGVSYLMGFIEDQNHPLSTSSRMIAASRLAELSRRAKTIGVYADPAPYSMPPVDLTRWQLLLLPANDSTIAEPDVIVRAIDAIPDPYNNPLYERFYATGHRTWFAARISWADKPFEILVRRELPLPR